MSELLCTCGTTMVCPDIGCDRNKAATPARESNPVREASRHAAQDLQLILQGVSRETPRARCVWTRDIDGAWQTACGQQWVLETGGPAENHVRYCHSCGQPIAIRLTLECPCCGDEGAVSDADGMFTAGSPLICGCLGSVVVDEDDGAWILLDEDPA